MPRKALASKPACFPVHMLQLQPQNYSNQLVKFITACPNYRHLDLGVEW